MSRFIYTVCILSTREQDAVTLPETLNSGQFLMQDFLSGADQI